MAEDLEESLSVLIKVVASLFIGVTSGYGGFYIGNFILGYSLNMAVGYALLFTSLTSTVSILWARDSHEYHSEEDF